MEYIIFQINGGIGKNVVATAVVRAINIQYPESKIIILTAYPEIWINNPRVYRIYKFGQISYFYDDYIKNKNSLILAQEPYLTTDYIYRNKHLSQLWCEMYNITWDGETPELYFTELEKNFVASLINKQSPILIIQPFGGGQMTHKYSWARDIPPSIAQYIVNNLYKDYRIIQIKREDQMGLNNVDYLTQNPRILAISLLFSDKRLLIDSYMQHAAAALKLNSVVLWIGNSPKVLGYEIHKNIISDFIPGDLIFSLFEPFDITGDPIQLSTSPDKLFDPEIIINAIKEN